MSALRCAPLRAAAAPRLRSAASRAAPLRSLPHGRASRTRRPALLPPRASAGGNGELPPVAAPPLRTLPPLAEVKDKSEAGSVERWWRAMAAYAMGAEPPDGATRETFGLAPPRAGEQPTVRWLLYESDPSLNQSLISEGTTISQLFDQDKWERHRRVDRYWRFMRNLSVSTVFRRILSPCAVLTAAAAAVCAYNLALVPMAHSLATTLPASAAVLEAPLAMLPLLSINLAPFSLISPMVGLLLVFRTNFSYARFLEGRLLWGAAVRHCRDVARLATAYLPPSDARAALLGHLQAWAWLLKAHLRAGRTRDTAGDPTAYRDDPSNDVNACLPPAQAEPLLAAPNRPFVTLCALTALLRHLRPGLPDYATRRIEEIITDMGAVAGGCERILSTPMPLSYTRFTGRALVMWLLALPLALWPLMGWATPAALFALSYVVLGIDEIGVEIEEPFCILPLQALCEAVRRDVGIAERESAKLALVWPAAA